MERGGVRWWSVPLFGIVTVVRPAFGRSLSVSSVGGSLVWLPPLPSLLVADLRGGVRWWSASGWGKMVERGGVRWWSVPFFGVVTVVRPAFGRSPSVLSVGGSLVGLLSLLCPLPGGFVDFTSLGDVR